MDPSFLEAFGINPAQRSVFATLETIAAEMKAASDAKKAAFEHYKNGLKRLRDHAQSFNSIHACNALPPTHVPSLTFDSEMELYVKFKFIRGAATITGPGDLTWFLASPRPSTRSVHICVTTPTGLPLLKIKQEGGMLSTSFSLSRYDPRTMTYKLACTIDFPMKMSLKLNRGLDFDLVPEPTLQAGPLGGGVITNGFLPHDGVIKGKLGGDLATVSETRFVSGKYNMKVAAGVDVLIMLGVVLLLDLVSPRGYREREQRRKDRFHGSSVGGSSFGGGSFGEGSAIGGGSFGGGSAFGGSTFGGSAFGGGGSCGGSSFGGGSSCGGSFGGF